MSLTLVIGDKNISSWSLRPWIALKQTAIPFREEVISLRLPDTQPRILKHSPSAKLPVLEDGDVTVWDSLAICEYLAERFPEKQLWPKDAKGRALARSISAEMHSGFPALRSACSFHLTTKMVGFGTPTDVARELVRLDAMWSDARARFGKGGPFLFGAFTIADAFYAPVVLRIDTYGLKVKGETREYCDTILALPAIKEWIAGAFEESVPRA